MLQNPSFNCAFVCVHIFRCLYIICAHKCLFEYKNILSTYDFKEAFSNASWHEIVSSQFCKFKTRGRNIGVLLVINFIMTDSSSVIPEQCLAESAKES